MTKKVIAILLFVTMVFSMLPTVVYATESGEYDGNENGYVQNEDGTETEFNPNGGSDTDADDEGPAGYVEQEDMPSKEEFYESNNMNVGGGTENSGNQGGPGNTTGVVGNDDIIIDESGTGFLTVKLEVPEDFYENVLVELYNRKTGEIVQIPVYASNNWLSKNDIAAGYYMVYNVLAGGDDALNPEWVFEAGAKLNVVTDKSCDLTIKLLKGPNFETETQPTEPVPDGPSGDMTDTELKPEDKLPDDQEKELTLGQKALNFLISLVTGPNLIILIVLAGSSIGYLYLKKKREED